MSFKENDVKIISRIENKDFANLKEELTDVITEKVKEKIEMKKAEFLKSLNKKGKDEDDDEEDNAEDEDDNDKDNAEDEDDNDDEDNVENKKGKRKKKWNF